MLRVAVFALGVAFGVLGPGCGIVLLAPPVEVSSDGWSVRTGTGDAPSGMDEIGPIEVTHGDDCHDSEHRGKVKRRGTFGSAYALLRNEAAQWGASYVQILQIVGPHSSVGCHDERFVIRGLAFEDTGDLDDSEELSNGCEPTCSAGYACEEGLCIALCNPPCSPGFECAEDRTCRPRTEAPNNDDDEAHGTQ